VSPPAGSDAAARIEGLADDLLPALIARLESSALGELEVRTADWRVRLCKGAGGEDRAAALAVSVAGTSGSAGGFAAAGHDHGVPLARELATTGAHLASAVGVLAAGGTGAGTAAAGSRGGAAVAAPHLPVPSRVLAGGTGTGTAAPQHHGPADTAIVHVAVSPAVGFLVVRDGYGPGRAVLAGEVVGHVDCLGVMRDVTAPEDGVIARNLAEQGEAVEYGQPLFDIEPRAPETPTPPAQPAPPAPPRPASPAAEGR
jgi:acetyl-CoA carboxylase biotin carboxyl carrier protein